MITPRNAAYVYLPDELPETIPKLYTAEGDPDPTVWVKLFTQEISGGILGAAHLDALELANHCVIGHRPGSDSHPGPCSRQPKE